MCFRLELGNSLCIRVVLDAQLSYKENCSTLFLIGLPIFLLLDRHYCFRCVWWSG